MIGIETACTAAHFTSLDCSCHRHRRLRDSPVSVYALHPGAVDTPLSRQLLPPVITHVIFALASWLQILKDPDQVGKPLRKPWAPTGLPNKATCTQAAPMVPAFQPSI